MPAEIQQNGGGMIGFIGGGNMAEALIRGMQTHGLIDIMVSEPQKERRDYLATHFGVSVTDKNRSLVDACPVVILAVKPQNMDDVLREIGDHAGEDTTIVSIAAGITLDYLKARLKTSYIVRVMPNTPGLVQQGISVISTASHLPDTVMEPVHSIFRSIGKTLVLPEHYMNAVTALSGSGPGFFAYVMECVIDAGVAVGLQKFHAEELATQTLLGTAHLLDSGIPPERLRKMVTSPGGTTAAGLKVFEDRELKSIIRDALDAAVRRAEELGRVKS